MLSAAAFFGNLRLYIIIIILFNVSEAETNNTVLFMIFSYFVIFIAVFNFKWWTYQLIYCLYYIHTDVLKCGLLAKYLFFLCIILFTFFQLYYNITLYTVWAFCGHKW